MAGLFRKRHFNKPWLASVITSKSNIYKSKVVKVLCKRCQSVYGSTVMLVSDGELSISAVFSDKAIQNAFSDLDVEPSAWNTALLILHEYTFELKTQPGQDIGEYVLYVERFNIWDLQPGYQAKYDPKFCMQHEGIYDRMKEELKERKESCNRAACQPESSMTGSIGLTQLLEEMAQPSESPPQTFLNEGRDSAQDLPESLLEKLIQPFTAEEFLIPASEASVLEGIEEWKPDYQPPAMSRQSEETLADQCFSVCADNTFSHDHDVKNLANNQEKGRSKEIGKDVEYLGISFISSPEEIEKEMVDRKFSGPVKALYKPSEVSESQSQVASSQWQEELESVRFSFEEDSCAMSSQESHTVPPRHVNTETELVVASSKGSTRLVKENVEVPLIQTSSNEKSSTTVSDNCSREATTCVRDVEKNQRQVPANCEKTISKDLSCGNVSDCQKEIHDLTENQKNVINNESEESEATKYVSEEGLSAEAPRSGSSNALLEDTSDSFNIGSPSAQSTQIKDIHVIGDSHGHLQQNLKINDDNFEGTKFVKNVSVGVNKTSPLQSYTSEKKESSEYVSPVQKCRRLPEVDTPAFTTASDEYIVETNTEEQHSDKSEASQDNIGDSQFHDVDTSVMQSYYSENNKLPLRNSNDVIVRLKKKRQQLVTKVIDGKTNISDKSGETLDDGDNSHSVQKDEMKIVKKCSENNMRNSGNSDRCGLPEKGMMGKLRGQVEEACKNGEQSAEIYSKYTEQEKTADENEANFCNISLHTGNKTVRECVSKLAENTDEENVIQNTAATSETGYPFSSLSLRETGEESCNYPLPFEVVLNQTNLEEIDKYHRKSIREDIVSKKETDQDTGQGSDQTDLEDIDKDHQLCINSLFGRKEVLSKKSPMLSEEERKRNLSAYQLAPEYFDAETGSKKRSEKLYAKVISCRKRENQLYGTKDAEFQCVGRSDVKENEIGAMDVETIDVENIETEKIVKQMHGNDGKMPGIEIHSDIKDDNFESDDGKSDDIVDFNVSEELDRSLCADRCPVNSRSVAQITNTIKIGNTEQLEKPKKSLHKEASKSHGRHVYLKSDCTKQKHAELLKDAIAVSDIRIVLERCDQSEEKQKREQSIHSSEKNDKLKEHKEKFTRLRSGKVTRQEVKPAHEESGINISVCKSKTRNVPQALDNVNLPAPAAKLNTLKAREMISKSKHVNVEKPEKVTAELLNNKSVIEIETDSSSNMHDSVGSIGIECKKLSKGSTYEILDGRKQSEMMALPESENLEQGVTDLLLRKCGTQSEPEMKTKPCEDENCADFHQEIDRKDVMKKRIPKKTITHTFEDQFKTWLKTGLANRNIDKVCKNPHEDNGNRSNSEQAGLSSKVIRDCKKTSIGDLNFPESVKLKSSGNRELADSHRISTGDISLEENLNKGDTSKDCGTGSVSSPVQCTQPFDVCPFPETQEFSPKMSETHPQKPVNESFTLFDNEVTDFEAVQGDKSLGADVSEKTRTFQSLPTEYRLGNDKTCENHPQNLELDKAIDSVNKCPISVQASQTGEKEQIIENVLSSRPVITRYKKSSSKQVAVKQQGQIQSLPDSKILQTHPETRSENEAVSQYETDKHFTNLTGRSENKGITDDFWHTTEPLKFDLKVKPVQNKTSWKKRKCDTSFAKNMVQLKRQKCKEKASKEHSGNTVRQKDTCEVITLSADNSDDSFEDFKVSVKKKESIAKTDNKVSPRRPREEQESVTHQKDLVPKYSKNELRKTYEPRKMVIDGQYFGNKVFWQNFVESPYSVDKQSSVEAKNKSSVVKTNKRKLSLDSSQGSQTKDYSNEHGKTTNDPESGQLNRSSESLFSEDNEAVDTNSDSVSLLRHEKNVFKRLQSCHSLRNDISQGQHKDNMAAGNKHENKGIGNGDLRILNKDGTPKFYREKHKSQIQNEDQYVLVEQSGTSKKESSQLSKVKKGIVGGETSLDIHVGLRNEAEIKEDKYTKQKPLLQNTKAATNISSPDNPPVADSKKTSVDKQFFIQNWLMKHERKGESGSKGLSPPDISTPENSLPSYQPDGASTDRSKDQTCGNMLSSEEQQGKDNPWDESSGSETCSSSESEESDRPMSAAAKYLLKLKRAREERKRNKLLAFKSSVRHQAQNYLKSCEKF